MFRHLVRCLAVATSAVLAIGCGASPPGGPATFELLEQMDVLQVTESRGRMWPAPTTAQLGRGFYCRRASRVDDARKRRSSADRPATDSATRRMCGGMAEAWLVSTWSGPHVLEAQLRRPGEMASQSVTIWLNETNLGRVSLERGWTQTRLRIPAGVVRFGTNAVRLGFATAPADPSGEAARIRSLELFPERDGGPATGAVGTDANRHSAAAATQPDSLAGTVRPRAGGRLAISGYAAVTVALAPGRGSRFLGELEAGGGSRRDGEARPDGKTNPSREAGSGSEPGWIEVEAEGSEPHRVEVATGEAVDLDLSQWAGRRVLLRLAGRPGTGSWLAPRIVGDVDWPVYRAPVPEVLITPDSDRKPDIVVVVMDALRADALGSYGAARPTPAFDSLAREGVRFERAFSTASWTAPAIASLLTGTMPDVHGVADWDSPLGPDISTIASELGAAGYRTVLWSHHLLWRSNRSLRRGFDEVALVGTRNRDRLPSARWLLSGETPTFALVHLLVPHGPYDAPERFAGVYAGAPELDVSPATLRAAGTRRGAWPSASLVEHARDRYDEMVRWADDRLASLVDDLRRNGGYDDSLMVVTADHGEAFFEHARFLHTPVLNRTVLGVPLIVKRPGGGAAGSSVAGPVSLIDVAATLRAFAGAGRVGGGPGGQSRVFVATQAEPGSAGADRPWSLIDGTHHLLVDPQSGRTTLYDLALDPREVDDLAAERPVLTGWLLQQLREARNSTR